MIKKQKSKEELKKQISENFTELNNLKKLYNTKVKIFSTCLHNASEEIQRINNKDEIDYLMTLLSKSKDNLDFLREQSRLIKKTLSLLNLIKQESNKLSSDSTKNTEDELFNTIYENIDKFNIICNTCRQNFYEHSIDDETLILDYINSSVLNVQKNLTPVGGVSMPVENTTNISTSNIFKAIPVNNATYGFNNVEEHNSVPLKSDNVDSLEKVPNTTKANETENSNVSNLVSDTAVAETVEPTPAQLPANPSNKKHITSKNNKYAINPSKKAKKNKKLAYKAHNNVVSSDTTLAETPNSSQPFLFNPEKDNTTLLISEVQNKVVLPYKVAELKEELKNSKEFKSLEELVNNNYIFPFSYFKNSSASRFKAGFSLMRKKEKSSVFDAIDLAFEVSFNNSLNPAVIAACNSLDQLDAYLDCMDANQLDKFNFFSVKYELFPVKK